MKIQIDFKEVSNPTAKQIDFVQEICRVLRITKPKEYTFEAYSEFISEHVDDYADVTHFLTTGFNEDIDYDFLAGDY